MWHARETGEVRKEFWCGHLRKRDHLEYLVVDGMIILKMDLQEVEWRGVDWIGLTQDRDRCRAVEIMAYLPITVPLANSIAALCPGRHQHGRSVDQTR